MNMKHLTCKFTMAITVLACLFAFPLRATAAEADGYGDIYSIYSPNSGDSSPLYPFESGDEIAIVVRMLAANPEVPTPYTWDFVPGSGYFGSADVLLAIRPPKIGIVVGNRMKYASWTGDRTVVNQAYTDFTFTYRVEAGDIARPIKLALSGSTEDSPIAAGSTASGAAAGYVLENVDDYNWVLKDNATTPNVPKFLYCTEGSARAKAAKQYHSVTRTLDYSLSQAGLYVQTVVLGESKEDAKKGAWEVGQGAEALFTVSTIGTPTNSVKLYAWSEDETVFKVVPDRSDNAGKWLKNPSGKIGDPDIPRDIFEFTIPSYQTSYSIPVQGVVQGGTANIILSTADNYVFDGAGSLVTNFIVRAVTCTEPPPPSVSFKFDGGKVIALTDASTEDVADINNDGIKVTVTLSEPFGEAADIQIKATLKDDPTVDVFAANMVGLQVASNEAFADPPAETNITMSAATTSATFYVYPLGGNDLTSSGGILFTPVITNETLNTKFGGNLKGCTLRIADNAPTIVKPTSADKLSGTSSAGCKIPVMINDCYRDMTSPDNKFDVSVDFSDSGHFETNGVVFLRNVATTILADGFGATATSAVVTVTDAQGNSVVSETIPLSVPKEKTISAELAASTTAEAEEGGVFDEGTRYNLRFRLGPDEASANVKDMYAFLLPLNEASSNLVETTATTNGVLIQANKLVSSTPSTIKFLDGNTASGNLKFRILLRGGDSLTDPVIDSYKSEDLYLVVNNVAPTVSGATVGGDEVSNGGTATIPAYAGQNIDLTITAYDPVVADLKPAIPGDVITAQFKITDGDANNPYTTTITTNFTTSSTKLTIKHPFNTANRTQTVTVRLQDKDMDEDEWGPEYTFKVNVKDAPSVNIFDWNGNSMEAYYPDFMEVNNGTGSKNPYVTVELSPAPIGVTASDPIVVKLDVTNLGDGSAAVVTNYVELTAVKPSAKVFLKDLNGITDSNFSITAEVTNETVNATAAAKWCDYYEKATGQFSVANVQPSIIAVTGASESITNNATLGSPKTLTVTVSDISLDVGSKDFKIVWSDEMGMDHYSSVTNYNVYGTTTNSVTASWDFTPKNEGTFTISVAIDDGGSNGRDERTFWFYVKPTKFLTTAASGPSSGDSLIELSRLYRSQEGIGKGRTYVTGKGVSATPTAKKFKVEWNCGTAYTANLWAYGYRWGDKEGSLSFVDAGDVDLDENGNSWASGKHYTYEPSDLCDSFFYGWIKPVTPGEKDYQIAVSPEDGTVNVGDGELQLPAELGEDEAGYKPTYAEAVFATEWDFHDNLGDIDHDGIPDIFALKTYKKGALATVNGAGGELGSGAAGNNDDGDFYPAASHLGDSPLLPGATSGWATSGTAFDAMREIRGYDDGLNYGMFRINTTERDAGWVSELSLSDGEKRSLVNHALVRRDAILHQMHYEKELDKYAIEDLIAITNLLRTLVRAGTTRESSTARPAFYTDYELRGGTVPGATWAVVTNTVEKWGTSWEEENTALIYTYTNASKVAVTITNVVHAITNIIDEATTNYYDASNINPFDYITLDDINFGDFLSTRSGKPLDGDDYVAARAYIERTWHLYDEYGTWGWTCENRTDPTTDDTDGDGLSDGYEYFLWYDAMVGVSGSNRLTGCKFNLLKPDSRDDVISSETIAGLYNPNIKRSWTGSDTDGDGLADIEEFLIGTSPIDWDTDLDGISDFYELAYNMNPLSSPAAKDSSSNSDGDYMAYAKASANLIDSTVPKMEEFANLAACTYIFTATNGTLWMLDYDATPDIWAALRADPETNAVTVVANGFEVVEFCGNYIPPTERTASLVPVSRTVIVDPQTPVITNTVSLYHHQVHNYFGFDPRTGWLRDPSTGNCSGRFGDTYGKAVNTTAYTAKNEYMLLRYRYIVGLRNHAKDLEDIAAGKTTIRNVILSGTTNPSLSFEAKTWGDSETSYSQSQHGADTDGDAVPDGWELYLGVNPNKKYTIAKGSPGYDELYWDAGTVWPAIGANKDYDDGLELAGEFAGTDSSGAHTACPTIYANHPDSENSAIKGWVNKYMPTDPRNRDTDGDGLPDGLEGSNWFDSYTINRWGQDGNRSKNTTTISGVQYHIIYGNPKSDPGNPCVRGGGLNPCSIDTDSDGLPDKWERDNAGLLFLNDEIATEDNSGKGVYVFPPIEGLPDASVYDDIRAAVSALGWDRSIYTNDVYHIIMGMDGTTADAYTKTGLRNHDLDWDGDGLQNWQEYMVQAMRQFRYDDDRTPLMGRDIPKFNRSTGKMDPGSWNGNEGYLQISRALPVTTEQHKALDELGYSNFVDYVSSNPDYLSALGYFAAPPMSWDQASGCLYMLPPTCTRVAGVARRITRTPTDVLDGAGNTVWGYAQSFDDYAFTIEEPDYLAIGWQTVTNTVAGPEAFYDPSLGISAYTDGQVLLHTNGVPFAYYVVVNTAASRLYPVMKLVNTTTTETYTPSNVTYTAGSYVGTDPRLWDTDEDGMDDYWELFHGLNPILGYVGDGEGTVVSNGTFTASLLTLSNAKDVIYKAYESAVSAWRNGWIGWDNIERPTYDPIRYPWMMGEGLCDADGDGLRNEEEALAANLTEPFTYHTDPTPLWMTDVTGSYTNRSGHLIYDVVTTNGDTNVSFFVPGGAGTPSWSVVTNTITNATASVRLMSSPSYAGLFYDYAAVFGSAVNGAATGSKFGFFSSEYAFSFEQNEGYDTDNDWRSDSIELKDAVEGTSDPLDVGDVQRRQSLWFGGSAKPGAAISYTPTVRNVHSYDLFRQFTVEAWVRPENPASGADQYIVSRASNYPGWDVANTNDVIRMNFALGVDSNGWAFAEMQDSSETNFRLSGGVLSPNVWTHLAASYDGSTFKVYVNGKEESSTTAILIPANGVTAIQQDAQYSGGFPYEEFSYNVAPSITILGARACGEGAFNVKDAAEVTGWAEVATNFFHGSVSEVRMWDGARKPADIASDFKVRYTADKVKELRDTVCGQYINGARRNTGDLDPELVQHYGMDSLPGATDENFVQLVPAGFKANVLDAVRDPDTGNVTTGDELAIGWWSAIVTNATLKPVYSSPHVVPWVENTVGHLPKTCGAVADSVYWSEHFAGYTPAAFHGLNKYSFANTMDPYGIVNTRDEAQYSYQKYNKLISYAGGGATSDDNRKVYRRERYDSNKGFSGTTDLLPLGSAFAKRLTEYWDGMGPEDAWAVTSKAGEDDGDPDLDGIPNWATNYTTTAEYIGALAKGARPDSAGGVSDPYSTLMLDVNGNGIPDWWEKVYGIVDQGAYDDADNDGLSNYHEWWLSEGGVAEGFGPDNGFPSLNPNKARSLYSDGQRVPDYFLGTTNSVSQWYDIYLGFIATDHDFIENWWEKQYANGYSNASVYDPLDDWDENGWSNYAEARYQMWRGLYSADLLDGWNVDGTYHADYSPEPALAVRSTYYGVQDLTSNTLHPQIPTIVTATRTSETAGRIDAKFIAVPSDVNNSDDGNACNQYLGPYRAGSIKHGFLSPGCVIPTTVLFYKSNVDDANYKFWKLVWETSVDGPNHWVEGSAPSVTNHYSGAISAYTSFIQSYPTAQLEQAPLQWNLVASVISDVQNRMGTIVHESGAKIGKIDLHSGEYSLDMAALAEVDSEQDQLPTCVFMVAYASKIGNEWPQTIYYSNTKELDLSVEGNQRGVGRVMEGKNTVTSLIDLDQSGDYTAGEPFGVISGVDVGWHKVPEQVVELRDTSHVVPRFDLMNLADDRTKVKGVAGLVTYTGNSLDTAAKVARIYIARTAINGEAAPNRTVLSKTYVLPDGGANSHARSFIHEGDVLNGGRYDLDWNWLAKDAVRMGISDIKSATYEIGQHVDLPDGSVSNVVLATFVNTFSASRAVAVAESPLDGGTVFSAAPKFRWTSDDDTVTAFDLQVFDTSENLVYDSGVKLLPGRVDGAYEFNPWLYADAPVSTNGAPVFADGTNYFWRVAMLNAKYNTADSTDEAVWSDKTPFRMDLSHKELTIGYGSANAIVRYYGPCGRKAMITGTETNFVWGAGAVQNISSGSGLVIVEAFENADFHGRPMAQIRLSDYADLYSTTNITTVNATLRGLDPGTLYFRAYIDLNNNGKREEWEPWGYANHIDSEWPNANGVRGDWEEWGNSLHYDGTGKVYSEAIYDPLGVVVTDNPSIEKPTFVIYIEDCDVNRNNIPDSLEEIEDESDTDRDGLPDSEEDEYGADKTMWDTDGDGMPDGWEVLYGGTDPLQPDADEAVSGDVMAYTEAVLTVVTFKDDPSAYIVVGDSIPQVGDPASLYTYVSTYAYGDGLGVGTNVAVAATATIDSVNKRDVVLIHAQVYDEFGFNPNTANPNVGEAESVNTKPFTALDKYLVVRYLQNVYGLADEDAVNLGKKWSEYTLKTGEPDCNKDGVPDGWELYVMFGSGAPATTLTGVAISPWKSAADVRDTTVDADGDAHTIIEEYNRGVVPTDPWKFDTDGDGINDRLSHKYGLAGDRYNEDDDRDGLSNYQEYLISEVYKLFALDANNPYTFKATTGQLVSDYFLRHGSLYLGELFSDHDMIEDWWEDGMPSTISLGGTLRSNFSRWIYEADWDADHDGWNGWSTARAWFNELYLATNIVYESDDVAVTNYYITSAVDDNNGNPNPKVQIRVVYNDKNGNHSYIGSASNPHQVIVKVWSLENGRADTGFGAPDCTWGGELKGESGVYELEGIASGYAASKGAIKPGRNMFVAYIAEGEWNEEGVTPAYVPNMPYGVAYDVEVGSISGANVNIELTDTNPSVARLDVYAILTAQAGNGTPLTAGSDPAKKAFANLIPTYTDRGAYDSGSLEMPQYIGNETTLSSSNIHIRVLRAGINGLEQKQGYLSSASVLIDRTMKVGVNHVLTEADLLLSLPSGEGDLDWGNLAFADSKFGGKANVTSATYRIVIGDGTVENTVKNNNLMIMFLNKFEALATQTPVSGMGRGTFAGRPTFSWKHENTIGKDYPAFQLRVWDGATVIYDSGVQRAPVRDQAGYYNWTPPLYIGAMLPNGKVFEPNKNYQWSVSMLDAKFTQPLANEEKVTFVVQETSPDPSAGDYGIIKVAVKYMGPGTVSTNTAAHCIRVEAFTTPDFSGEPVGVGYVTDATTINSTTNLDINSKIVGLPQGDKYYVRAFLDTDVKSAEGGYGQRAPWESWGYASYRDPKEVRNDTFTPCPVAATNKDAAEPCVVFIEDCDTNRNMVPDILETTAAGATTLYSPYIAYTASDAAKTNAVMAAMSGTNGDKNSVKRTRALLAYASATEAAESGTVTAGELAVLIGNVSFDTVDSANIRITSFSLDDGISLEVDVDGAFEGAVSAGYDTGLINVTVEYSKTLDNGGDWQRAGEVVTLSFSLTQPTTKIDASELVAIKDAIKAAKNNGGCYFRVSAVAFER